MSNIKTYLKTITSHLIVYSLLLNTLVGCATIVPFEPKNIPSQEEINKIPSLSEKYFFGEDIFVSFDYDLEKQEINKINKIIVYNKSKGSYYKPNKDLYKNLARSNQLSYINRLNTLIKYDKKYVMNCKGCANGRYIDDYDYASFLGTYNVSTLDEVIKINNFYVKNHQSYKQNRLKHTKDCIKIENNQVYPCIFSSDIIHKSLNTTKKQSIHPNLFFPPYWFIMTLSMIHTTKARKEVYEGFVIKKTDEKKLNILRKALLPKIYKQLKKLSQTKYDIKAYKSTIRTPNIPLDYKYYKRYFNKDIKKAINSATRISQLNRLEKALKQLNLSKSYARAIQYKKDSLVGKQNKQSFEELMQRNAP